MLRPREQHYTGNYGPETEDRYADLWRAVRAMWAENAAWHAGRDDRGQSQPLPHEWYEREADKQLKEMERV